MLDRLALRHGLRPPYVRRVGIRAIAEGFAREHDRIIIYRRTGGTLELKPVAVDVVNASRERLVIEQERNFREMIEGSDLVVREPENDSQLFAFTTCSYQTRNSRTTVYAGL